jgi:hypothetical protein
MTGDDEADRAQASPKLDATRHLLASVEELRALLAPLSEEDRRRVLDLARTLRARPRSSA